MRDPHEWEAEDREAARLLTEAETQYARLLALYEDDDPAWRTAYEEYERTLLKMVGHA